MAYSISGSRALSLWSQQSEFWSAIAGAVVGSVVGGAIGYLVQIKALREGRRQREEDRKQAQQAQGRALLIKVGRIISNCYGTQRHFEGWFERAQP